MNKKKIESFPFDSNSNNEIKLNNVKKIEIIKIKKEEKKIVKFESNTSINNNLKNKDIKEDSFKKGVGTEIFLDKLKCLNENNDKNIKTFIVYFKVLIIMQLIISIIFLLIITLNFRFLYFFALLVLFVFSKLFYDLYLNFKNRKNISRIKKFENLRQIFFDICLVLHNLGAILNFFYNINIVYFSVFYLFDSIFITILYIIYFKALENFKFDLNLFFIIIHYLILIQIINNCLKFNNIFYSNWISTFWIIYLILFIMAIFGFIFFLIFIYMLYYFLLGNETNYNFWGSFYGGFFLISNNIIYFFLIFKIGNYLDCNNIINCELNVKNDSLFLSIFYWSISIILLILIFLLQNHISKSILENFINPNLKNKRKFIINELVNKKIFPKNLVI